MNRAELYSGVRNLFRRKTWRFGVRFPHQGARECARRVARQA